MPSDWPQRLDAIVDRQGPHMIAVRWRLHAHTEPSGEQRRITRYLFELLTKAGEQRQITRYLFELLTQHPASITPTRAT